MITKTVTNAIITNNTIIVFTGDTDMFLKETLSI